MFFIFVGAYLIFSFFSSIHAVVIQGNETTAPFGFTQPVTTTAYNPFSGTFYVGLASGAGTYALAQATPPTFSVVPTFSPLVQSTTSSLSNQPMEFISFISNPTVPGALAVVINAGTNKTQSALNAIRTDSKNQATEVTLHDAAGSTTGGIVSVSSNEGFVFSGVRPNAGNFGAVGGGIALTQVTITTNATTNSITLTTKNATTGLNGNIATPLDRESDVIDGGTNAVTFQSGSNADNTIDTFWDEQLQRLYTGVLITTGTDMTDIGKSVVVGRLQNGLQLEEIVANSAITGAPVDEIIVAQGNEISLSARYVRVAHVTTGPDYLIVYGGQDTLDNVGNRVRALPLVNLPSEPTIHGTLANVNSPLVNGKFVTPATAAGDLFTETDPAAIVGAGDLPIEPDDTISHIVVENDTVYVSIALAPSATNDTGIFSSRALFDSSGKVIRWTPWQRAAPFNLFPNNSLPGGLSQDGRVNFFEVDAKTGNITIVEGATGQVVGITTWPQSISTLPTRVTQALPKGSFAILDLNQNTRGFLNNTIDRYVLFGGLNTVVFTRVSQAEDISSPSSPQTIITDFNSTQNFLTTTLPARSGCIQTLEYSRRLQAEGNQNFFFAGTDKGLFVYANNSGGGFSANQLSALDQTPFAGGIWQKVPSINGSVIDIKTSGNGNLYVLTLESTPTAPFLQNVLYSIPFASSIVTMFNPANLRVIAQTQTGIFENALQFTGIEIVSTGDPTSDVAAPLKEQLVLTTSQGLYVTNANQVGVNTGIPEATNQTNANWVIIPGTETTFFAGISGTNSPITNTVWPFTLESSNPSCKTFNQSSIFQLSGAGNPLNMGDNAIFGNFVPLDFNAASQSPTFTTLPPILSFFTDGSRRFFINQFASSSPSTSNLAVLPYNVNVWNVPTFVPLNNPGLSGVQRFNYVGTTGAQGLIVAGINNGIIPLG